MVKTRGGYSKHFPTKQEGEIYEIARKYEKENVPLIVVAGKEYEPDHQEIGQQKEQSF